MSEQINSNQLQQPVVGISPPVDVQLEGIIREIEPGVQQSNKSLGNAEQTKAIPGTHKLQEILDYLRVCVKYQVFDLEATRRENEYLRKRLEECGQ